MSVINYQFEHVFIHVPKTAGTSMERLNCVGGNGHETALQLKQHVPDHYLFWAFVRNPYDRILSAYHSLKANPHHHTPDVDSLSFEAWIESGISSSTSVFWSYAHTQPMHFYLCDNDKNVLTNFIGRFENLEDDWRELCRIANFNYVRLPALNVSNKRPPRTSFYTKKETKAKVWQIYRDDFELFGYDSTL